MKNRWMMTVFAAVLAVGLLCIAILPDQEVSLSERRTLRSFPKLTWNGVFDGTWTGKLENWLPDQFPARDTFRSAAMLFRTHVLRLSDYNGAYVAQGKIVKTEYPLRAEAVQKLAQNMERLQDAMFAGCSSYCALIPDKGTFLAAASAHLTLDFSRMEQILTENLNHISYISIKDTLNADSYYDTDIHWRQEAILPTAQVLSAGMRSELPETTYHAYSYTPFYGSYFSQATGIRAEQLLYLESETTKDALVTNLQKPEMHMVYDTATLGGMDSYDVFLSGATPLITVENAHPAAQVAGKTLILLRDSFGSSIAPLLLPAYEKIILVDLRYMPASLLPEYVQIDNPAATDILFLYGAVSANNSEMFRF